MAKKAYIGVANFVPRALPSGYTQVEYIESDGAQYIDSGVNGKSGLEVYAKWMYTNNSYKRAIIGCLGNDVRTYPMHHSASNYGYAYQSWVASSLVMEVNTVYNLYTKLYPGEQIVQVNGETIATGSKAGEYDCGCPMYIFALYNEGSPSNYSVARLYSMQIYDNGILVRDYVPCTNSTGVAGLYDMANGVFYQNAGTGTFAVGTSTYTSVARKIKKGYLGIDGIARKIKKAYIGIGGVARPCWSGGELAYYGAITPLSVAVEYLAAARVGNYALFGGGHDGNNESKVVNAYDTSLVRTIPTSLGAARNQLAATSVGNYAVFGGGKQGSSLSASEVYAYNTSLTRSSPSSKLVNNAHNLGAATVGNYAIFAGGQSSSTGIATATAYNGSLTRSAPTKLSEARYDPGTATVGGWAIFAGGGAQSKVVNAYNESLTMKTLTSLSVQRYGAGSTTVGNYAIFCGGRHSGITLGTNVDAYDASLTRSTATALSQARYGAAATTLGKNAIISGGWCDSGVATVVDVYDESLTRISKTWNTGTSDGAAITIGDYALFAGGYDTTWSSAVEAFTLA